MIKEKQQQLADTPRRPGAGCLPGDQATGFMLTTHEHQ
jgi:hypothetical protein